MEELWLGFPQEANLFESYVRAPAWTETLSKKNQHHVGLGGAKPLVWADGAPCAVSRGWYLCCSAELVKPWAWLCAIHVARIRALAMPGPRRGEGRGDQVFSLCPCLECSRPWSQGCYSALCGGDGLPWCCQRLSSGVNWMGSQQGGTWHCQENLPGAQHLASRGV